MERYTIYCTPEQTKKALEFGAPIYIYDKINSDAIRELDVTLKNKVELDNGLYAEIPTAEQMCGWLLEKVDDIEVVKHIDGSWIFAFYPTTSMEHECKIFPSRKEATLAAIDAALDYLEKGGNK